MHDFDEVLVTTPSVRKRLDLKRPVERAVIEECLDIAVHAPNGSNQQPYRFLFVDDEDRKTALADSYRFFSRGQAQRHGVHHLPSSAIY